MIAVGDVSFPKPYQGELAFRQTYHAPDLSATDLYDCYVGQQRSG